ncbi:hypothetical protein F7725_021115 [Dissostichus mawsoni]|uniref:Uncharacterized protein n=1 Tax=Dissostichus mawsoni TaxID=36200 RepID=A0A7J5YHV7_DISMA|nr:hypothetical protein F7725_021115 [Dissostichus mawsoni]
MTYVPLKPPHCDATRCPGAGQTHKVTTANVAGKQRGTHLDLNKTQKKNMWCTRTGSPPLCLRGVSLVSGPSCASRASSSKHCRRTATRSRPPGRKSCVSTGPRPRRYPSRQPGENHWTRGTVAPSSCPPPLLGTHHHPPPVTSLSAPEPRPSLKNRTRPVASKVSRNLVVSLMYPPMAQTPPRTATPPARQVAPESRATRVQQSVRAKALRGSGRRGPGAQRSVERSRVSLESSRAERLLPPNAKMESPQPSRPSMARGCTMGGRSIQRSSTASYSCTAADTEPVLRIPPATNSRSPTAVQPGLTRDPRAASFSHFPVRGSKQSTVRSLEAALSSSRGVRSTQTIFFSNMPSRGLSGPPRASPAAEGPSSWQSLRLSSWDSSPGRRWCSSAGMLVLRPAPRRVVNLRLRVHAQPVGAQQATQRAVVQQQEVLLTGDSGEVLSHETQRGAEQQLVVVRASQRVHPQTVIHREVLKQEPGEVRKEKKVEEGGELEYMRLGDLPGAQVLKGHDLQPVGGHKQILRRVQREPRLTGVNKLDHRLHDGRCDLLQSDLSEAGLHQRAGEHRPEIRTHRCQQDSEEREG